ncbi:hypothetical protein CB1_000684001 [Camelus ferus]|nr:hypothetical protein CB1_000684001 [Camelus ferus]
MNVEANLKLKMRKRKPTAGGQPCSSSGVQTGPQTNQGPPTAQGADFQENGLPLGRKHQSLSCGELMPILTDTVGLRFKLHRGPSWFHSQASGAVLAPGFPSLEGLSPIQAKLHAREKVIPVQKGRCKPSGLSHIPNQSKDCHHTQANPTPTEILLQLHGTPCHP